MSKRIETTDLNVYYGDFRAVEDVTITQVSKQGINDVRSEGGTLLSVKNTTIANNAGVGIVAAATATNSVVLDNVHSFKNTYGLAIAKNNSVTANRSVFAGNSASGVQADASALLMLDNSVLSSNAVGLSASGGLVAFGNTDITFNGTGITGTTTSFGNNRIFGNTIAGIVPTPAGVAAPALGQQ